MLLLILPPPYEMVEPQYPLGYSLVISFSISVPTNEQHSG